MDIFINSIIFTCVFFSFKAMYEDSLLVGLLMLTTTGIFTAITN